MDELDMRLAIELATDTRITFRELAKRLNLSVNAVHKRFKSLQDEGIIYCLTTTPYPTAVGSSLWLLAANFDSRMEYTIAKTLADEEMAITVYTTTGNRAYILLASIPGEDIESAAHSLAERNNLQDVFLDEIAIPPHKGSLDRTDHCIISAMKDDSRRPLQEISDITGISMKTLKKRLKRLMEDNLVWMRLKWSPLITGDFYCLMTATLSDPSRLNEMFNVAKKDCGNNLTSIISFKGNPDQVILSLWGRRMADIQTCKNRLLVSGLFSDVSYQILTGKEESDSWLDKVSRNVCSKRNDDILQGP